MAKVPKFTADLHIIAKLGINPGPENGLDPDQLQEKFDEAAVLLQEFINDQLIPVVNSYVASSDGLLSIDGGVMRGNIDMGSLYRVVHVLDPANSDDAATKGYVDNAAKKYFPKDGGTLNGNLNMGNHSISGLPAPESENEPATKKYTDELVKTKINGVWHATQITLNASSWASKNQRISIPGLKKNSVVFAEPDANDGENIRAYRDSDVWAYKQEDGYLHFWHYEDKPARNLVVNVVFNTEA